MKMLNDQEYAHIMLCLKSLQERCKRYETTILKQERIIKDDEYKERAYKRKIEFLENEDRVKGYYESEINEVNKELAKRIKREKELEHAVRGKKIALRELNKAMVRKNEEIDELTDKANKIDVVIVMNYNTWSLFVDGVEKHTLNTEEWNNIFLGDLYLAYLEIIKKWGKAFNSKYVNVIRIKGDDIQQCLYHYND